MFDKVRQITGADRMTLDMTAMERAISEEWGRGINVKLTQEPGERVDGIGYHGRVVL